MAATTMAEVKPAPSGAQLTAGLVFVTAKAPDDQQKVLAAFKKIVEQMPGTTAAERTQRSNAIARITMAQADPKLMFDEAGKLKESARKDLLPMLTQGMGTSTAMIEGADGIQYRASGVVVDGKFNVRLMVPVADVPPPTQKVMGEELPRIPSSEEVMKVLASVRAPAAPLSIPAKAAEAAKPADAPKPPVKPQARVMSADERTKAIDKILSVKAEGDEQQKAMIAKLAKLANGLPEGDKKKKLLEDLKDPKKVFDDKGLMTKSVKDQFAEQLGDTAVEVTTKKGKKMVAFGQTKKSDSPGNPSTITLTAEVPSDALSSDTGIALDKVKTPKKLDSGKLTVPVDMSGATPKIAEADVEAFDAAGEELDEGNGIVEPGADGAGAGTVTGGGNPGGKMAYGKRKGLGDKATSTGSLIGAGLGGILGFMLGGPIGAIIGLLVGALGGMMLGGNSPFEAQESLTLSPTDTKFQVRTPEGETPVMEIGMPLEGNRKTIIKGQANENGKFLVTESVTLSTVPGQGMERKKYNPPLEIDIDPKDGSVDKEALYQAVTGAKAPDAAALATPPAADSPSRARGANPDGPGRGTGAGAGVGAGAGAGAAPKPPATAVGITNIRKVGTGFDQSFTFDARMSDGSTKKYRAQAGYAGGSPHAGVAIGSITGADGVPVVFPGQGLVIRGDISSPPLLYNALQGATPQLMQAVNKAQGGVDAPAAGARTEAVTAIRPRATLGAAAPATAESVEVTLDKPQLKTTATPTTYVIKGADGRPMAAVVGAMQNGKFVVSAYGTPDPANLDATLAPRVMTPPMSFAASGDQVNFTQVMSEIRSKQDPVRVTMKGISKKEPSKPVTMQVEVGNGADRETLMVSGTVKGNTVVFDKIGGKDDSGNLRFVPLQADQQFSVSVAAFQNGANGLTASGSAGSLDTELTNNGKLQTALVGFSTSADAGRFSVASAADVDPTMDDLGSMRNGVEGVRGAAADTGRGPII